MGVPRASAQQLYQAPLPYLTAFPPSDTAVSGIDPAFSLANQNGLTYVGTSYAILLAYDASVPAFPRLMAMNVVGGALDTVAAISPGSNALYLAVQGAEVQMGNSIPENSIELYYPPAALSLAYPATDAVEDGNNPKLDRPLRNSRLKPGLGTHSGLTLH